MIAKPLVLYYCENEQLVLIESVKVARSGRPSIGKQRASDFGSGSGCRTFVFPSDNPNAATKVPRAISCISPDGKRFLDRSDVNTRRRHFSQEEAEGTSLYELPGSRELPRLSVVPYGYDLDATWTRGVLNKGSALDYWSVEP